MRESQRPALDAATHDGKMLSVNCAAVAWAFAQPVSSASAKMLLLEIARRTDGSRCEATQIDLGRACALSERQTRTLLALLAHEGFVQRTRQGGKGKGRAPDAYEMIGYQQPAIPAACVAEEATGNGQSLPVLTEATGNFDRQSPPVAATGSQSPPTPPYNTNSLFEGLGSSSDNPETSFERGPGKTKPPRAPRKPRRPRREKFYAAEDTMPTEPNAEMGAYAAAKHLLNGTREAEFEKFRRYHIRAQTLISSLEQRWETWVDNWAKSNPIPPSGGKPGYRELGLGADGKMRYEAVKRSHYP